MNGIRITARMAPLSPRVSSYEANRVSAASSRKAAAGAASSAKGEAGPAPSCRAISGTYPRVTASTTE